MEKIANWFNLCSVCQCELIKNIIKIIKSESIEVQTEIINHIKEYGNLAGYEQYFIELASCYITDIYALSDDFDENDIITEENIWNFIKFDIPGYILTNNLI